MLHPKRSFRARCLVVGSSLLALCYLMAGCVAGDEIEPPAGLQQRDASSRQGVLIDLEPPLGLSTVCRRGWFGRGCRSDDNSDRLVTASRVFAEGNQFPPEEFAAYGILAFRTRPPTDEARERYLVICNGYTSALRDAREWAEAGVALPRQMVTVWPVQSFEAFELEVERLSKERIRKEAQCEAAVDGVDERVSRLAIRYAELATGEHVATDRGPYLIAWAPGAQFGEEDVPVLVWNLSDVVSAEMAAEMFAAWADEIERDPYAWSNGWRTEHLRLRISAWSERYGDSLILKFLEDR